MSKATNNTQPTIQINSMHSTKFCGTTETICTQISVVIITRSLMIIVQHDMRLKHLTYKPYRFSTPHCQTKLTGEICSIRLISIMSKIYAF